MDQVKIRATVSAHGLLKGQEALVAETAAVAGAITSGVFTELERYDDSIPPEPAVEAGSVQKIEDVELPPVDDDDDPVEE